MGRLFAMPSNMYREVGGRPQVFAGREFLSYAPFFGLSLWYGVGGGKLRMRKWVELFDEPQPHSHFLAVFKFCPYIELLASFQQEKICTP